MMMAIIAATPLMVKASSCADHMVFIALAVFIVSMIALYGASALYHSVTVKDSILKIFRKLDHMMIFVLIAGSYTPVCLVILGDRRGYSLLATVWSIAIAGMIIKMCWITCPKWFSSILYIAIFGTLWNTLSRAAFSWLLAGGIFYTVGGVIYALKLPIFNEKHKGFGSHEIFHLFVMGGSVCHFIFMYFYVA